MGVRNKKWLNRNSALSKLFHFMHSDWNQPSARTNLLWWVWDWAVRTCTESRWFVWRRHRAGFCWIWCPLQFQPIRWNPKIAGSPGPCSLPILILKFSYSLFLLSFSSMSISGRRFLIKFVYESAPVSICSLWSTAWKLRIESCFFNIMGSDLLRTLKTCLFGMFLAFRPAPFNTFILVVLCTLNFNDFAVCASNPEIVEVICPSIPCKIPLIMLGRSDRVHSPRC